MGIFWIIGDMSKSYNGKDRIKYKKNTMVYGQTWNEIHFPSTIEKENYDQIKVQYQFRIHYYLDPLMDSLDWRGADK